MSKNKGFSDTSANRYSLALFELASESNLLTQVEENSTSILNLISNNEDFKNFVKDPTLSRDDLLKTINMISESLKLEKLFKNFIIFLITCLLYTSDAADDLLCVDLGGRRIIKKKI